MKCEKYLWSSISLLIGAVIVVLSLFRGPWQIWLLLGVFTLWGLWIVNCQLMPMIQRTKRRMARRAAQTDTTNEALDAANARTTQVTEVMMRHVNHRITAYLHSLYPDATWSWCDEGAAETVIAGGITRIQVFGVDDHAYADIQLDPNGIICLSMVEIHKNPDAEEEAIPPNRQPIDPQLWYAASGRAVLEEVIAELNSRGHSRILLKENGEIVIEQNDEKVVTRRLTGFPAKVYWSRLTEILKGDGLNALTLPGGLQISW